MTATGLVILAGKGPVSYDLAGRQMWQLERLMTFISSTRTITANLLFFNGIPVSTYSLLPQSEQSPKVFHLNKLHIKKKKTEQTQV
jgi:hypothetical protein